MVISIYIISRFAKEIYSNYFSIARMFLCLSFCAFSSFIAIGQTYKDVEKLIVNGKYYEAKKSVESVKLISDEQKLLIKGVANYHTANYELALEDLKKAAQAEVKNPLVYKYAGMSSYALGYLYDASNYYRSYLSELEPKSKEFDIVNHELKRIQANLTFSRPEEMGIVENLGDKVNTKDDEVRPIQSPSNLNKYYFSSNREGSAGGLRNASGLKDLEFGKYKYDMYSVQLEEGNWLSVDVFNSLQNSALNEIVQGFSQNGEVIYYLKTGHKDSNKGSLYCDTFNLDPEKRIFPKEINTGFLPEIGDKDLFFFNDSIWIFSSRRKGGFGGYDLYSMHYTAEGWQKPENLGPEVNSAYDEISPCLTKGSRLLFYSSNRLEGIGGFDVFYSAYSTSKLSWTKGKNLGAPINSSTDDKDLFISSDGNQAVLSSNRKGGIGGFDLYMIYFKDQIIDQLEYLELPYFISDRGQITDTSSENGEILKIVVEEPTSTVVTLPSRDYLNTPILYNGEDISSSGLVILRDVRELMKIYPELKLTFVVGSLPRSLPEFDLFQSSKMGEKAASFILQDKSIKKDRIEVIGLGSNFPAIGLNESLSSKVNDNIKVIFNNPYPNNLMISDDEVTIKSSLMDSKYKNAYSILTTMGYAVIFTSTNQMLRNDLVKTNKEVFIKKNMVNPSNNKYFIGFYRTYEEAKSSRLDLLKKNILTAKIIPLIKGKELPIEDLELYKDQYPDLAQYLINEQNK
jgi:hypothetical protein